MTPTGDISAVASGSPVRGPSRTCIGCRAKFAQGRLLRFVRRSDGHVIPANVTRDVSGRSTYLCPRRACLDQAIKRRAFARAFGTAKRRLSVVDVDANALWAATAEQLRCEIELIGRTSSDLSPRRPADQPPHNLRRRGLEQLLSELSSQPQASQLPAHTPREGGAPSHG